MDTKSLVTGATGLIGKRLLKALGPDVVVLSRDAGKASRSLGVKAFDWDGRGPVPAAALEGVGTVYHLAGESVMGRWNDEKKERIVASRHHGTRALVESIAGRDIALVSASAVGLYGDRGDAVLDEDSAPGEGFLADVCKVWEAEAEKHTGRCAIVRVGIVLAPEGGALKAMLPAFKLGVAGKLGDGKQWQPWIHIDDLVGIFLHAAEKGRGPLNGTAPNPVTNETFTKALGAVLHRPTILPAPAFALKLALGEMGGIVLASQRVVPKRTLASGYTFKFPEIDTAFRDLLG